MKLNKINRSSNKKWFWSAIIISALAILLAVSGCNEELDAEDECLQDLDNQNFSAVADNSDCSTYERASAHMGLAGFLFENFLQEGAEDNFRAALDIPDGETKWEGTPRKYHYEQARRLTGDSTGDYYDGRSRSLADTELHLFASMGSIISEAYIKFDTTPDGEITEEEIENFTQMVSEGDVSRDITVDLMLFKKSADEIFLMEIKTSGSRCAKYDSTYDYAGIWDSADSTDDFIDCGVITVEDTFNEQGEPTTDINITGECSFIAKVNELKFFKDDKNVGETATQVVNLANSLFTLVEEVDRDLESMDISSDSELQDNLDSFKEDFVYRLDNGGNCAEDTDLAQTLELGMQLIGSAASKDPSNDYSQKYISFQNLKDDIDNSDRLELIKTIEFGQGISLTFSCEDGSGSQSDNDIMIGLTFVAESAEDGYVPYYGEPDASDQYCIKKDDECVLAKDSIRNTLNTLYSVTQDMTTDSTANDQEVSFEEMICFDPTGDIL